ncbi:MAG TPA: hypothetical protein PK156_44220 [Polyangium sp.]|nr:hypothetical protein [Polyangium sp.]
MRPDDQALEGQGSADAKRCRRVRRYLLYRLGRILLGKTKAEALRDEPSWFDAALREHRSEHPPAPEGGGWDEIVTLLDGPWYALARGLANAGLPVPDQVDWDIIRQGRVTGQRATMAWTQQSPFVALVSGLVEAVIGGQFVTVTPESDPVEVAAQVRSLLGGSR